MAEYNVDILVKAKIQQAERALDALKKKIDSISKNPVIKVGAKGIQDVKTYASALKDLGLKGAAARGGLAALTLQLGKFGGVTTKATGLAAGLTSGLGGLVAKTTAIAAGWGTLGASLAASGQAFNLATKAAAGTEQILGQILATLGQMPATWGAAAVAAMAFAPQVAKAGTALNNAVGEKATKSIAATVQQFNNLNEQVKFTATSFQDLIRGSTLNQLNAQLQDANRQIGEYRSNTEEARISAQQLVAVTKAQAVEQRAINDLVRQARGITQTELEESKAIKALETKRRKQAYLTEEANKYNLEIDEYNRLAREAAEVTKKWEQSLRGVNTAAKAGVLGSTSQIRARLQEMRENRQSVEIARQRSAALMGTSGAMQGPGALGDVARAEANRVALRAQAVRLLEQERQKAQQNLQLMQNWTTVLQQGPKILTDMQRLRAKELQDRKDAFVVANRELQLELKLRDIQERRAATQEKTTQRRGAAANALIGGAFPLLFGQSGAAAVGGALGGVAGGLMGGAFGFALSLVGTAIGDVIDKADRLDKGLRALNASVTNTGSATQTTAQSVRGLASALSMETDQVLELLSAYRQFKNGQTREALVGLFTGVGEASTFEAIAAAGVDQQKALQAIIGLRKIIGNEAAKTLLLDLKINGSLGTQQKLLAYVTNESIKSRVAVASQVNFWDEVKGRLAQAVVLAAQLAAFLERFQIGGIKIPGLENVITRLKDISPEKLAKDRGKALETRLKNDMKRIQDALTQETELVRLEDKLTESMTNSKRKKERQSQLAQLQNAYILLVEQATVQKDLYMAEFRNNQIAAVRFNQTLKLLEIRKQENDIALEDIPTQEKAVKLKSLQVEKYRASLEAAYQIMVIEQQINEAREKALGGSNERINRLQAEIQGRERDYDLTQRIQELEKAGVENAADQANAEFQLLDIKNRQIEAQQQLNSLVNQLGTSTTQVFEDLIFATNSWQQSLANALKTMASALFRFGLNTLADAGDPTGQGVGLLSILTGRFGKRANGGPVSAGSPYLVGERGPELFMPKASGTVIPNNALGMGGANVVVNVDASGSNVEGNADQANQLGKVIGLAVQQELVKQKRPGGLLA